MKKGIFLKDQIEYQAGAIVSKELLKKEGGSVSIFAFDEGQGLSEHTTPFGALIMILEGRSRISVGGNENDVSEGGLIELPADVPHSVKAEGRFKMLLIMLK